MVGSAIVGEAVGLGSKVGVDVGVSGELVGVGSAVGITSISGTNCWLSFML